jgi:hypothetical protein
MPLYYDRDPREDRPRQREDGSYEEIRVCTVCADVDCLIHPEPGAEAAELTASVVAQARHVLDAWDVSEDVPRRLSVQLSLLSDALAELDGLPF